MNFSPNIKHGIPDSQKTGGSKNHDWSSLLLISTLFVLAGILKYLYVIFDGEGAAPAPLSHAIKRAVYALYENTQLLSAIWNHAPAPNPKDILSSGTLGFLACYIGVFLGASMLRSGIRLAKRLRIIDRQIEDEILRESIRPGRRRTKKEIEKNVFIPMQATWKEVHTLYIAPLVVGVLLLALGKLMGLG